MPTINFGNRLYNDAHSVLWGAAALVPFFYDALADADEHNWTAHFGGFVRVAEAGAYNFSVLFDDGFFFRLLGAGGTAVGIGQDFLNPRDRRGFDHDLLLSPGLYGFELGMWNRAEAGVVDLRWMLPGSTSWTLVPGEHLRPLQQLPPQTLPAAAPPLAVPAVAADRGAGAARPGPARRQLRYGPSRRGQARWRDGLNLDPAVTRSPPTRAVVAVAG